MKQAVPVVFATIVILAAGLAAGEDKTGFRTSLFDGKTLHGWTIENKCEAEVRDGVILLKAGNGWLRSDHKYRDFKFHFQWRALQKEDWDSGVYIRTLAGGEPFPKVSYQINLKPELVGNIKNIPGTTPAKVVHPPGEWNTGEVTVVGDMVALAINDQPSYQVKGLKVASGHVGLQCEVIKGGQVEFRDLWITEFDTKSLFNGRDLAGWEGAGEAADKCWRVEEGVLLCTGAKGPWLRSKEILDDFNLRLEYMLAAGANSGVYVRVPENGVHHRENRAAPPAGFEVQILDDQDPQYKNLKNYQYTGSVYDIIGASEHVGRPPGEWNTLEINCNKQHVTITHNGKVVVDGDSQAYPLLELRQTRGYLGLQNHSSQVRFRNLRIGPAE